MITEAALFAHPGRILINDHFHRADGGSEHRRRIVGSIVVSSAMALRNDIIRIAKMRGDNRRLFVDRERKKTSRPSRHGQSERVQKTAQRENVFPHGASP